MKNSEIIFLEDKKAFLYDGKDIKSADLKDSKKIFTASIVSLEYIKTLTFKMPKSYSESALQTQIEIKMYNEAGLNPDKDYIIDYLKYDIEDEEEFVIEGFALSKDNFKKEFGNLNRKIESIDLLFPRFLAYQAVYNKGLSKDKNDLFIFLDEDEAFGAIYKNGKYIGHRVIDSLSVISRNTGIEGAKLKEYLSKNGLKKENYTLEETDILDSLQNIFLKNVEKLIYAANHKRSMFGFTDIDRVIIDFNGEFINGLNELFATYGYEDIKIQRLKCCVDDYAKTKLYLYCEYAYEVANNVENIQKINLSFWERKKPLINYKIFKYALIFLFFILLSFIVYGYFYYQVSLMDKKISIKQEELKKTKSLSSKYTQKIQELKKENKKILSDIKRLKHQEIVNEATLKIVPTLQKNKLDREKFMNDIITILAKYRLNTKYIKQKDSKNMEIMLISKNNQRDKIAEFINSVLQKGYSEAKSSKIYYDNGFYKSIVRIKK